MKKVWSTIFFLAAGSQLVAQFLPEGWLHWISKPLLMIALAGYYFGSTGKSSFSIVVFIAILFSFFGDVFLMLQDTNGMYFIIGLVSFLTAHIFYVFAYRQHVTTADGMGLNTIQKIRFSFPFMLLGTGLVTVLYPGLGELRVPVVIYAMVLVTMVLAALFRYERTTTTSFWMVFGGAFFFMVSDSLLAINKFYTPIALSGVWIMTTYILAQFMIVQGLVDHK